MLSKDHSTILGAERHSPTYSSRYMTSGLPKHNLPQESISPNEAFLVVRDLLSLDRNATQNMATFVTSWIEKEGEDLMNLTYTKNMADMQQYPQMKDIQERCVSILSSIFHSDCKGDHSVGVATIGSSEASMLGCLSLKYKWREKMQQAGKPTDRPNLVFGKNTHVCIEKFCRFFDVEARAVSVSKDTDYCLSVEGAMEQVDENTIGIVGILGSTFTGHFEPIQELNEAVDRIRKERGYHLSIHVDAASGGFIAPFLYPDVVWDFRLSHVNSINVSSHKYGLVPPGLGWCIFRNRQCLHDDLIFHLDYLGGVSDTYSINFSKSSSPLFAQYYNFVRLGRDGYYKVLSNCRNIAMELAQRLVKSQYFEVVSAPETGLPVVAFHLSEKFLKDHPSLHFSEFDIVANLMKHGWQVPAYRLPEDCHDTVIMRVVIREIHSEDLIVKLFNDIIWSVEDLLKFSHRIVKSEGGHAKSQATEGGHVKSQASEGGEHATPQPPPEGKYTESQIPEEQVSAQQSEEKQDRFSQFISYKTFASRPIC